MKKALLGKDFKGRTILIAAARSGSQDVFDAVLATLNEELGRQKVLSIEWFLRHLSRASPAMWRAFFHRSDDVNRDPAHIQSFLKPIIRLDTGGDRACCGFVIRTLPVHHSCCKVTNVHVSCLPFVWDESYLHICHCLFV